MFHLLIFSNILDQQAFLHEATYTLILGTKKQILKFHVFCQSNIGKLHGKDEIKWKNTTLEQRELRRA